MSRAALIDRVLELRGQRMSYRDIAREVDVAPSTVGRWLRTRESETPEHGHRWRIDWQEGGSYRWVCANEGCGLVLEERAETDAFLVDCKGAD